MKLAMVVLSAAVIFGWVASAGGENKPERRAINKPGRPAELPFSDAVLAGDTLYLSGDIGLDPTTGKPPDSPEAEARLVLDSIKATLAAAGMTMDDLVSVTVHSPDVSLWERFNGVYRGYFKKELPARAFVGSGPLLFGARFEVQAIAVRR
jgi:reactive intermediate/imine deaminase